MCCHRNQAHYLSTHLICLNLEIIKLDRFHGNFPFGPLQRPCQRHLSALSCFGISTTPRANIQTLDTLPLSLHSHICLLRAIVLGQRKPWQKKKTQNQQRQSSLTVCVCSPLVHFSACNNSAFPSDFYKSLTKTCRLLAIFCG